MNPYLSNASEVFLNLLVSKYGENTEISPNGIKVLLGHVNNQTNFPESLSNKCISAPFSADQLNQCVNNQVKILTI